MSDYKELKEKLFYTQKNGLLKEDISAEVEEFSNGYKDFLGASKTERLCVKKSIEILKKAGFIEFSYGKEYKAGDRVFINNRGKALAIAVIGQKTVDNGTRIAAAHIDSPRLDLKPNPLYEDSELALFKTHYYGGIKKYQWTAIPLALHGVIMKKDGTKTLFTL